MSVQRQMVTLSLLLLLPIAAMSRITLPVAASSLGSQASGGLGLTLKEWELHHGKGTKATGGFLQYEHYGDVKQGAPFRYAVMPLSDRVWFLVYQTDESKDLIPIADARALAAQLIPLDSQQVSTSTDRDGNPMDVFVSDWLIGQFPADEWKNDRIGTFSIIYSSDDGNMVWQFVISLGSKDS